MTMRQHNIQDEHTAAPSHTAAAPRTYSSANAERIGRGWAVSCHPVALEPPFASPQYRTQPEERVVDDARRPSLVTSLFARWRTPPLQLEPIPEPPPNASINKTNDAPQSVERTFAQLRVPQSLKITPAATEQFLLSLAHTSAPISFEIIGSGSVIAVQLSCAEAEAVQVTEQCRAHFPDAAIINTDDFLRERWAEDRALVSVVADFGLTRDYALPLNVARAFDPDPLAAIIGALASLETNALGALQILFQPVRRPWHEAILRAANQPQSKSRFPNEREFEKRSKEKASRPLYAAVIRIVGRSASKERTWRIVRALGSALAQFSDPTSNQLTPISNSGYDDRAHEQDVLRRETHRSGMILNVAEIASLVHLPSLSIVSEKLLRDAQNTRAAPLVASGHELVLGENSHNGQIVPVTLSEAQRMRHLYIIGTSGTGKTTLILNTILQDVERGAGCAVIEPHGDLIDAILDRIPAHRHKDVVLFDPSDENYPIGFNPLVAHTELEKQLIASDLVAVFRRLSTSWGDQLGTILSNAVLAFLESSEGGTLLDLRRFLVEAEFRKAFLATINDDEVIYYWTKVFPLLKSNPQAPILTRLDAFLRPKLIRRIVGQKHSRVNFRQVMDERKIFLAKLSHGSIGEQNAYLLGTLIVSKFHQMALSRQEQAESERTPFFMTIDEFHNFATPSLAEMLTGIRKYAFGIAVAHQELRQLWNRDADVASAVLSNPYSRIAFRVGDFDAEKLEGGFAHFDKKDLQNLGVGEAIVRMERASFDFNLKTHPVPNVDGDAAQQNRARIIDLSRTQYAMRRDEVETAIARAMETGQPSSVLQASRTRRAPAISSTAKAEPSRTEAPTTRGLAQPMPRDATAPNIILPEASAQEPALTPLPVSPPIEAAPKQGRGGRQHQYLQSLIKQFAESKGFRSVIEHPVLDGAGSIDVALEREGTRIACEISITSTDKYELHNIQKCFAAGYERVVVISPALRTLNKIKARATEQLGMEALSRVQFLLPEELSMFFDEYTTGIAIDETMVRGYKVKVNYKPLDHTEEQTRKQAISKTIAQALRRMKQPSD